MSDNKKYEARVREIAEEMALRDYPFLAQPQYREKFDDHIIRRLPSARIAVRHMADQYRKGFAAGYFDRVADDVTIDEWLQAIGLIPKPEQRKEAEEV